MLAPSFPAELPSRVDTTSHLDDSGSHLRSHADARPQVVVERVHAGYPAESLPPGDFVLAINDFPVSDADATIKLLNSLAGQVCLT